MYYIVQHNFNSKQRRDKIESRTDQEAHLLSLLSGIPHSTTFEGFNFLQIENCDIRQKAHLGNGDYHCNFILVFYLHVSFISLIPRPSPLHVQYAA